MVVYNNDSNVIKGKIANCQMKTGIKKGTEIPLYKEQLTEFSLKKWSEMRKKYDRVS